MFDSLIAFSLISSRSLSPLPGFLLSVFLSSILFYLLTDQAIKLSVDCSLF